MSSLKINRIVVGAIAGIIFGSGMIISEMVNPHKVIAFLDIFGQWDPSLAFVMIGALVVFAPCYYLLIKKRKTAINGDAIAPKNSNKIDAKLTVGAIVFGIGWGLAGFCPGPAIINLGGGNYAAFVFVAAMILGMVIANKYLASRS